MNYPSPCDSCENPCNSGCADWRIRYLYRQKQINAYARKLYQSQRLGTSSVFCQAKPPMS